MFLAWCLRVCAYFFFSSRRRHTRWNCGWSSDVCSSDLERGADVEAVKTLTGPSSEGTRIVGGASRKIGPGDVVVIPPNTPHTFTEITSDQIVYLVVRIDPHKVLPTGYVNK